MAKIKNSMPVSGTDKGDKPGSLPYIWKRLKKNPGAITGLVFVVLLFFHSYPHSYADMIIRKLL